MDKKMKKTLFVMAVAAFAMTACTNEKNEYVGDNTPKEIAFKPLTQMPTRAAVQGTTFPTTNTMEVVAYQSTPTAVNYFEKTQFTYNSTATKWTGSKYWPLSQATLNFFAISAAGVDRTDISIPNTLPSTTTGATVAYTAGKSYTATNSDIMYSFNRGSVSLAGNVLGFSDVNMIFMHTQTQVRFQIKAGNAASEGITINSITVNDASVTGNLTIKPTTSDDNTNITKSTGDVNFTATWTDVPDGAAHLVPNSNIGALANGTFKPADAAANDVRAALLIIPNNGFSGFTINYSYDGKNYSYTYTDNHATADQGRVYSYKITMTLHEIEVVPTVTDWDNTKTEVTPTIG